MRDRKRSRARNSLTIVLGAMFLILLASITAQAQTGELPPNPDPGKCYVKCITKDTFRTVEETIEVAPEHTVLKIIPATYRTVEERVLIKEASKKLVYVPAEYTTTEVSYVEKEGRTDLEIVPAQFGSASKKFETYPVTGGWEYTTLTDCPSINKEDCVVACYVEYPAQSTTVAQVTLTSDASTNGVPVAEVPATFTRQVVKVPARMEEVEIPAEYAVITKKVVDTPARVEKVVVPAEYETVTRTVLDVKGGITVWEEVDCDIVGTYNVLPILYDYNSAAITPESKKIIDDNLLALMKDKPALSIEIASHTDSRGNDEYNMSLSQARAQSVVNYLVSRGISRSRLTARGFGESRLKNRCSNGVACSEEEHHANRRTEFRILN